MSGKGITLKKILNFVKTFLCLIEVVLEFFDKRLNARNGRWKLVFHIRSDAANIKLA